MVPQVRDGNDAASSSSDWVVVGSSDEEAGDLPGAVLEQLLLSGIHADLLALGLDADAFLREDMGKGAGKGKGRARGKGAGKRKGGGKVKDKGRGDCMGKGTGEGGGKGRTRAEAFEELAQVGCWHEGAPWESFRLGWPVSRWPERFSIHREGMGMDAGRGKCQGKGTGQGKGTALGEVKREGEGRGRTGAAASEDLAHVGYWHEGAPRKLFRLGWPVSLWPERLSA